MRQSSLFYAVALGVLFAAGLLLGYGAADTIRARSMTAPPTTNVPGGGLCTPVVLYSDANTSIFRCSGTLVTYMGTTKAPPVVWQYPPPSGYLYDVPPVEEWVVGSTYWNAWGVR